MEWLLIEIPGIDVSVLLIAGLIGLWFLVRNRQTPMEPGGLDPIIGRGEPVVLEFFGKLWMSCLAAKPVVNGIEKDLEGTARVIRLEISSEPGRAGAKAYGVMSVPTTLVLDGRGEVVHRETGIPDRGAVVGRARRPGQPLPTRDELHDRTDLR